MSKRPLTYVLEQLEATEANLVRLESVCREIEEMVPAGIEFGANPTYDDKCRIARSLAQSLPWIEGLRIPLEFQDLNDIAQTRMDAFEIGEPSIEIALLESIQNPSRQVAEYRFHFNRKRRELSRDALDSAIDGFDRILAQLVSSSEGLTERDSLPEPFISELRHCFSQIATLMGTSFPRPPKWGDLSRHVQFGQAWDLADIRTRDWPTVKSHIRANLYAPDEPLPVAVGDLSELNPIDASVPIPTALHWDKLSDEDFERLLFALITSEAMYENPAWLTKTRAADRGRDLSATRVAHDNLSGTRYDRVIVQCKHWLGKSIGVDEIATLKQQMKLWGPPRVDVLIVATSGHFTTDAIALVENLRQEDTALEIEMWNRSHLELLLAARPDLIAEFGLRS